MTMQEFNASNLLVNRSKSIPFHRRMLRGSCQFLCMVVPLDVHFFGFQSQSRTSCDESPVKVDD